MEGRLQTMNQKQRKLPVGIESFWEIRKENFYYIDKTGMIRDLLQKWSKVNLFTRPRRFGKSLNMSMLRTFFELGCDPSLFEGLEIAKETELCEKYMGKFPVISLSLKGVDGRSFSEAAAALRRVIGNEAFRFSYLAESERLLPEEKKIYQALIDTQDGRFTMADDVLADSLHTLSRFLAKHHGRKVILLIDEYDVPLDKAFRSGYYDEMISLIRGMFSNALKTNDSLQFAVLTGCLRISKESIFTGLNNLNVLSVTDVQYDDYFGFTDREVREMLEYYDISDAYDAVKSWYDGYRFGDAEVYCPWDVICFCSRRIDNPRLFPQNYWSNTSSNEIIQRFIRMTGNGLTKSEVEALVAGEALTKEIREDLTYNSLYDSIEHLWSLLLATGYLTQRGTFDGRSYQLAIPNMEIRSLFRDQILSLFKEDVKKDGERRSAFCEALKTGNAPEAERLFTDYLKQTIRIRDTFVRRPTKENFFHGILLGILGFKDGWFVKSNRESDEGYSDILVKIEDEEIGLLIEVKYAQRGELESACKKALQQIQEKGYAAELREDGCHTIYQYGIACFRKQCRIAVEKEEG